MLFIYLYPALIIFTNNLREQTYPTHLPSPIFPTTIHCEVGWAEIKWLGQSHKLAYMIKVLSGVVP